MCDEVDGRGAVQLASSLVLMVAVLTELRLLSIVTYGGGVVHLGTDHSVLRVPTHLLCSPLLGFPSLKRTSLVRGGVWGHG